MVYYDISAEKRTNFIFTQAQSINPEDDIAVQQQDNFTYRSRKQVSLRACLDIESSDLVPEVLEKAKILASEYIEGKIVLVKTGCDNGDFVAFFCGLILNHNITLAKEFLKKFKRPDQEYMLDMSLVLTTKFYSFTEVYFAILMNSEWKEFLTMQKENILHLAARKNDGGLTAICILNLLDQESKDRMLSRESKLGKRTPFLEAALNGDLETFEAIAIHMPDWKKTQLAQIIPMLNSMGHVDKIKDLNTKFNLGGTITVTSSGRPLMHFNRLSPACILSKSSDAIVQTDNERRKAIADSCNQDANQGLSMSI